MDAVNALPRTSLDRLATVSVVALLVGTPLFHFGTSVDIVDAKWAFAAAITALGVLAAAFARTAPARSGLLGGAAAVALLVVAVCGWIGQARAGLDPAGGLAGLGRIATLLAVLGLASAVCSRPASRVPIAIAAAIAPTMVLVLQGALERGADFFGLPFHASRYTATLGNSAYVGLFAMASLPWISIASRHVAAPWRRRLFALALFLPALVLVHRSEARAAWIGAALILSGSAVAALLRRLSKRRSGPAVGDETLKRHQVIVGIIMALGAVAASNGGTPGLRDAGERVRTIADRSHVTNRIRFHLWHDAARMTQDHALLGVGPGRFGDVHDRYREPEEWQTSGFASRAVHPHNEYLRFASEAGVIGLSALIFLAVSLLQMLWTRSRGRRLESGVALLAMALVAAVWDVFAQPATAIPFVMLLAFEMGREANEGEPRAGATRWLWPLIAVAGAVAVIVPVTAECAVRRAISRIVAFKKTMAGITAGGERTPEAVLADLGLLGRELAAAAEDSRVSSETRHRAILEVDDLASTRRKLAEGLSKQGSAENAEESRSLARIVALLPDDQTYRRLLARAVELAPNDTALRVVAASFELGAGRAAEARSHIDDGLRVNPHAPLLRRESARLRFASQLYDKAFEDLRAELVDHGKNPDSDPTWEMLARTLGATGNLRDAVHVVGLWVESLGDQPRRWAVAGELCLHFGETIESVGQFLDDSSTVAERTERGAFLAQSLIGAAKDVRRETLLAHLGRYPNDAPVLDGLAEALQEYFSDRLADDDLKQLREQRRRAITRSKILYAHEHYLVGDDRLFEISLRAARRLTPDARDAYLLEVLQAVTKNDAAGAVVALKAWKQAELGPLDAFRRVPEIAAFMDRPDIVRQLPSD